MRYPDLAKLCLALSSALSLAACSGGGDDDDGGNGSGTVVAPWSDYCTGTFTANTPVADPFGDPMFTAKAGEEYLLSDYDFSAHFVYLTSAGPDEFEVEPDAGGAWPFTSNCMPGSGVAYNAVFTDVSVYADAGLSTKICDLAAGTVRPAGSGPRGAALAGDISFSGPATYEVYLDSLAADCGGNTTGYISVPQTSSFGVTTWLIPITGIIGPT